MKYYKSQNQYFPTENVPQLESEASLLDLSSRGRYLVLVRNLEYWEKRALKLVVINSYGDLFSSAAYLCLQQESMSVNALSRLLEAVAKSIKHATAMSTILATELFQARRDTAIATSKVLMDNSSHELRNAPISSRQMFDKGVAKANYEAQLRRFLASSSTNVNSQQQQKSAYSATGAFKKPRQLTKTYRPKQNQPYRSKTQSQSFTSSTRKDFFKRSSNSK